MFVNEEMSQGASHTENEQQSVSALEKSAQTRTPVPEPLQKRKIANQSKVEQDPSAISLNNSTIRNGSSPQPSNQSLQDTPSKEAWETPPPSNQSLQDTPSKEAQMNPPPSNPSSKQHVPVVLLKPCPKERLCRSAVCRCWYCCPFHCLCCPILWIYGVAVFTFAVGIGYIWFTNLEHIILSIEFLCLIFATVLYSYLFVMLTQLVYILILYESIHWCGKCLFGFLFISTCLICIGGLILSAFVPEFGALKGRKTPTQIKHPDWTGIVKVFKYIHLALSGLSGLTLGLLMILLHLYLYNILQFDADASYLDDPERLPCKPKSSPVRVATEASIMKIKSYPSCEEDNWKDNTPSFKEIMKKHRYISPE